MKCRYLFAAVSAFLLLVLASLSWGQKKQSVRTELSALQQATGLTVAEVGFHGTSQISFAERSWRPLSDSGKSIQIEGGAVSPDGELLAAQLRLHGSSLWPSFLTVARLDGSGLREYRDVKNPFGVCWSPEKTRLALSVPVPYQPQTSSLVLLNLETGVTQEIYKGRLAYTQTQCFSPDGMNIVYGADNSQDEHHPDPRIFIYDVQAHRAREITTGGYPTWTPDGKSIAFLDHKVYYLIGPQGTKRKKLFKNVSAYSALWWSPDSRFVAYNAYCCLWESLKAMADIGRLHVRRLDDGADDWVAYTSPHEDSFNWVRIPANKTDQNQKLTADRTDDTDLH